MFPESTLITDGVRDAVVVASTESFVVAVPADGGDEFVLSATDAANWTVRGNTPRATIAHPHCVYRADGTRLDGYADLERAHRRARKFLGGQGYFIVSITPEMMTWVAPTR